MNTAIAITAIIAAALVINSIVMAVRDVAKAKHQPAATSVPAPARCTVEQCATVGTLAEPGGDWTRDAKGRHFCPAHPAATSCRICGRDKGANLIICGPCARDDNKETQA